jgi:glycosyltransferase involved in cell wall biosynthesis
MPEQRLSSVKRTDVPLDIVVLGGFPWGDASNHTAVQTVRALTSTHRVLYVCDDPRGSTLRHLLAPRSGRSAAWSAPRTAALSDVFARMRAERVSERLWVAPLRGLTKLLPLSYPEPVRARSAARLSDFIGRETQRIGMQSPVLWFYWWFFPELAERSSGVTVYDNIDDHSAYDHNRRWTSVRRASGALEQRLLKAVDLAYALSPELATQMRSAQPAMGVQTPGIDADAVTRALAEPSRPRDLAALAHPLIGYAGQIGNRLDWQLIARLAWAHPEWTFAFVGGERPPGLASSPNVRFLPGRPYPEMMRAIREFDVGLVPWVDSPATRGAYSYKALDYLAAGKQVVATQLPFSEDLAARHPAVIATARSLDDWSTAIVHALERSPLLSTASACIAAAHSRTTLTRTTEILADVRARMDQPVR